MERVARVMVTCSDDKISRWAEEDERTEQEVITELKEDFEEYINSKKNRWQSNVQLMIVKMGFLEWENFCPKCESTDLDWRLGSDKAPHRRDYKCRDCEHEFTEEEMIA